MTKKAGQQLLLDYYQSIYSNRDAWCYFSKFDNPIGENVIEAFESAEKFIKEYLNAGNKAGLLVEFSKFKLDKLRWQHTLSAYLGGILIQKELHIDIRRGIPQLEKHKVIKNFLYFWAMICLTHDFAHSIESESKNSEKNNLLWECSSIPSFEKKFEIEHNFIEACQSEDRDLYEKYYNYRITYGENDEENNKNIKKCIDHGIAGALIIYNALIKLGNQPREESSYTFSKEYKKHVFFIANTIAKHNLWRACKDNKLSYKKRKMYSLIPTDTDDKRIYLDKKEENLLFLLGLIDTIEPIKMFKKIDVMKQLEFGFKYETQNSKIDRTIEIKSIDLPRTVEYGNAIQEAETWLGVKVESIKEGYSGKKICFL